MYKLPNPCLLKFDRFALFGLDFNGCLEYILFQMSHNFTVTSGKQHSTTFIINLVRQSQSSSKLFVLGIVWTQQLYHNFWLSCLTCIDVK